MEGYTDRWGKEGETWKKILSIVQSIAEPLAKKWDAEITREHWDHPKIDIRWYTEDDIGRSIQIHIKGLPEDYRFDIEGSCWKDDFRLGKRLWIIKSFKTISIPEQLSSLSHKDIESALDYAYSIVSKWREADLKEESKLPPHNRSFLGNILKGKYVP